MKKSTGQSKQDRMVSGSIPGALMMLSGPMLVGALLQNAQSLIDLFWVGRVGANAVAGVAMGGTILMVLFPMLMGLSTGTIALVSRAVGAGRMEDACAAAGQSLLMAMGMGAAFGVLGWILSDHLLRLLGAPPGVFEAGSGYLRITLIGSFTVFVLFIANAALQGAGDTVTPMYLMGISNVLNIVLDPLLIFGPGPFPRWGVNGAACATVLAQAAAAMLALYILVSGRAGLHVRRAHWRPDPPLFWRILRIGLPGSGQMLSRSLMGAVMMRIVASCGAATVAAYGIGMRLHMIILMPAFALGGAAATMMGQNLGAMRPDRAGRAAWTATVMDMGIMALCAVGLMLFPAELIRLFSHDPAVIAIGVVYLRVLSPFYVLIAPAIILGRALNGAGDSLSPMICTIVALWGLQVPLAVHFSRAWTMPAEGVWWAMVAASMLHAALITGWFLTGRWRTMAV